jgi:FAD/FMN-containing dehydrogenase
MEYDPNFHELEYFVQWDRAMEAFEALRELMLASQPTAVFPMEVRSVGADEAMLSPQFERDTIVLSVSGQPGTDYWEYLRSVDALLGGEFGARVHWGKLHFLTRDQLLERYPHAQDFIDVRRHFDPRGLFLNDHLRPLFV